MKIYILRHEKRYDSHDYDTSLTEEGLSNANKLKDVLKKLDLDIIFSSPYKRTIQTVEPFLKESKKKIHIDYALNESLYMDNCKKNIRPITKDMYGYDYINTDYTPVVNYTILDCKESRQTLCDRIKKFYKTVIHSSQLKDKNILVVSHMSPINCFLDRKIMTFYPQGGVSLIYDDDKTIFKKINF